MRLLKRLTPPLTPGTQSPKGGQTPGSRASVHICVHFYTYKIIKKNLEKFSQKVLTFKKFLDIMIVSRYFLIYSIKRMVLQMVKENGMVMMTERELEHLQWEHDNKIEEYEKRLEFMHTAILALTQKTDTVPHDMRVSKADFLAIYAKALDDFFDKMETPNGEELHNDIDGYDLTVHWHGIYCNCGNGATPSNNLIPGIEGVNDEDPCEDWGE